MALTINSSLASINANRSLSRSTAALNTTFARISSGLRINSAKDDAAGLAISDRMTAQILSMNSAIRNTNDGISLVQVAEGALAETADAMQRIRELAVQANTTTMSGVDQNLLQVEVTELMAEIERIATTTEFNNINVLDGSFATEPFQIGPNKGETITVSISDADATALGLSTGTNAGLNMSIGSGAAAANGIGAIITKVDTAIDSVSDIRANLGAYQGRFESIVSSLNTLSEVTQGARSQIMDADIATETANLTRQTILQQAGLAILAQANQQPVIALTLLESL
jgi:flagellin